MLTDHDIAQLMNAHSLQGGNNDSPWWLAFARAVERAAVENECKHTDSLLTMLGLDYSRCRSEGGTLMPRKVLTLMADAGHPLRVSELDCELLGNGLAYIIREYPKKAEHARALLERMRPANKSLDNVTKLSTSEELLMQDELVERARNAWADAQRYCWLKSRQGLTLRSEKQPNVWKNMDGTEFRATHSLAEGGTQHAPAESLDALIDAAMLAARIRDA